MDFSFSPEQTLLQDSVTRFIQQDYSFEMRRKLIDTEPGFSRDNWQNFADLGWLALPFDESLGGFGGGPVETMILMEAFGKGLVVEPYVPTVMLAGQCLAAGGSPAHREQVLTEIMAGNKLAALAFVEPQARFNIADVKTRAGGHGDYVIDGFKGVVLGGPAADYLIVSARTGGEQRDESGITLFLLDANAPGIVRRDYVTIDGHRASEVTLTGVKAKPDDIVGEAGEGLSLLQRTIDYATLAVGAEAVGAMEVLYKSTVEYCQTREQFGQPIGKFQVLQHRMVDMFMEHEQTKSLMYMAALRLGQEDSVEAGKAVSALKVRVGKGGRFVGQSAVQLHGGMGMTDELAIGHYFKRLTAIDTLFGNADYHLKRYARL